MAEKIRIKAIVEGGNASAGPPLGPSLAQAKMNVSQIVSAINEKTKDFKGISVPIEVIADPDTKEFEIKVGTPPVSSLIKQELGLKKLAKAPFGTYKPKEGETVESSPKN